MKTTLLLLLAFGWATAGCSATNSCVPGQSIACVCAGGASGAQACQASGTFAACDCGGGPQTDGGRSTNPDFSGGNRDFSGTVPGGGKRIFLTSASYSGNLKQAGGGTSGLDGADRLCNSAATGAALGGTWKAWLSDANTNALDRIADVGPWFTTKGAKAFNNKANLTTTPLTELTVNESGGVTAGFVVAWTGTQNGGTRSGIDCQGWGLTGALDEGTVGAPSQQTDWTLIAGDANRGCTENNHLYCLEQ